MSHPNERRARSVEVFSGVGRGACPQVASTALMISAALLLAACVQPTQEELLEAEAARQAQCREMLEEVEDAADRPLIRASLQENYNRQCLGVEYPDQQQ